MGQDNNKCTCFNTKEDTVTANFEKNKKNVTNSNNSNRNSNVSEQPVIKNLKSYVTFKNMDNYSIEEIAILIFYVMSMEIKKRLIF